MFLKIVFVVVFALLISMAYASLQGAPWVPTWKRDMTRVAKLLALKPGERFIELGCGNARVCRYLKKISPGSEVVGIELSVLQYLIGSLQNFFQRSGVKMKFGNIFQHDLIGHDAVYMFLMPQTYEKIRPKLESELKLGARVVTYAWPILGWDYSEVDETQGAMKIYLYRR